MSLLTEQDIGDAWDESPRNRPLGHQDDWRATSFREFARGFARLIEQRVVARMHEQEHARMES
jgi:hypothetical protein